jgi:molybdopterin-binding protein
LQLEIGAKVFALIKASAIEIALTESAMRNRTNQFIGVVDLLVRGEQRAEVQIALDAGMHLVATTDNSVLDTLQLKKLMRVYCYVDPSDVILAVAA